MKNLKDIISEKLIINKNIKIDKYHYYPKDKKELKELIDKLIKERGNDAGLNDIDTSKITDMGGLFEGSYFDGDISEWNTSNVTWMVNMFKNSQFTGKNGNISNWDVNKVVNMSWMFTNCPLKNNPPKWYKK